jgi:hypothetical protein
MRHPRRQVETKESRISMTAPGLYRRADEDIFIGSAASATARRAPWRESQGAGWPRPATEGTKASPFVGSPVLDDESRRAVTMVHDWGNGTSENVCWNHPVSAAASRLGQPFQARRHVDPVAVDIRPPNELNSRRAERP